MLIQVLVSRHLSFINIQSNDYLPLGSSTSKGGEEDVGTSTCDPTLQADKVKCDALCVLDGLEIGDCRKFRGSYRCICIL